MLLLEYRLDAPPLVTLDRPALVRFKVENRSEVDVWLLRWYTPLEGVRGEIFDVRCDGVRLHYEGRMMKRGEPTRNDYARIPAGGSADSEFDLHLAYVLQPCRECRVAFCGRLHDVTTDPGSVPRGAAAHRLMEIEGNETVFEVAPAAGSR